VISELYEYEKKQDLDRVDILIIIIIIGNEVVYSPIIRLRV